MFKYLVTVVLICYLIKIFYKISKSNRKKIEKQENGRIGEYNTANQLSMLSDKYHIINNVLIQTGNGFSQIDHIVVSKFGIYVIETKNFRGIISGSENNPNWILDYGEGKTSFYNPIMQNNTHINILSSVLGLDKSKFKSIINFSRRCVFNIETKTEITYTDNLCSTIEKTYSTILSEEQVKNAIDKINKINVVNDENVKKHIRNIKKTHKINKKCPICGASLIARDGKYGKFYGCSNYPDCSYTKSVS